MSMFFSEYRENEGLHQPNVDEPFYVTEAEFVFQTGDQPVNAVTGDIVFIPANMPHTFLAMSETGKLLLAVNPPTPLKPCLTG